MVVIKECNDWAVWKMLKGDPLKIGDDCHGNSCGMCLCIIGKSDDSRCVHTDKNLVGRLGTIWLCDIKCVMVVVVWTIGAMCVVRHFRLCDHVV